MRFRKSKRSSEELIEDPLISELQAIMRRMGVRMELAVETFAEEPAYTDGTPISVIRQRQAIDRALTIRVDRINLIELCIDFAKHFNEIPGTDSYMGPDDVEKMARNLDGFLSLGRSDLIRDLVDEDYLASNDAWVEQWSRVTTPEDVDAAFTARDEASVRTAEEVLGFRSESSPE